MQIRVIRGLLGLSFLLSAHFLSAQSLPTACRTAANIVYTLEKQHFQPRELDDQFSTELYQHFLENVDEKGFFFTKQDLEAFANFRLQLDDELQQGNCQFLPLVAKRYRARLQFVDSLLNHYKTATLDFSVEEEISEEMLEGGLQHYTPTSSALADRWRKRLKYWTLVRLVEQDKQLSEAPAALSEVIQQLDCQLTELIASPQAANQKIATTYLETLPLLYDPHTNYFAYDEKMAFEEELSDNAYALGLNLTEAKNGEFEVAKLVPGGPAWKSNQLHQGDVIVEVVLGNEEKLDLLCMSLAEVEMRMHSATVKQVTLKVRKRDKQVRTVTLRKEKLEVTENVVNSFLLKGDHTIGYIYLPGFYTSWENDQAHGCANDVAKELLKLQLAGMEGLVLDLRFNGGGSIGEAINLSGIFIDEGPLSILQNKGEEPETLKDFNRGAAYDGPLVVLVNGLSASASEMFAAAMQDYRRAVIVGQPTFGKATGQVIAPVEVRPGTLTAQDAAMQSFLKITIHQINRISGQTHQRTGVIPDISLPNTLTFFAPREDDYGFTFSGNILEETIPYKTLPSLPLSQLIARNDARLAADERFSQVKQMADAIPTLLETESSYPLEYHEFRQQYLATQAIWDSVEEEDSHPTSAFRVDNNSYNEGILEADEFKKLLNDELIQKISHDRYIEASFHILSDLIVLGK